jgi:pilus assembly protein CpaD
MSMRKFVKSTVARGFPVALLALSLAGCAANDFAADNTYEPLSPSERFPIEYAKGPVTMAVATTEGTLQMSQVNAISGFARQSTSGGLSPVTVRRPAGGGKSARVAQEVAGLLMQNGVPRNMIRMSTYSAPASAPVQVSYVKAYAHTRPCGDWSQDATHSSTNMQMPNHGCAVQSNIAAMIANPEHIVAPAPSSLPTGTAAVSAIDAMSTASTSTSSSSAPAAATP